MPTLIQVLDGEPPANTAAIRVETFPGSKWSYSGGGYTIMQQMVLDVTRERFPDFMRQTVLAPLAMSHSSYEQPLPSDLAKTTAAGHYPDGSGVRGRWHIYPEMAAAGLWTTPTDLARFAIEVQQAYAGKSARIISQATARQMLTNQKDNDGLGVFLRGSGASLVFSHGGRDEGFDADLTATAETGQGAAIMINANDNSRMVSRIREFIAKKYHWPSVSDFVVPVVVSRPLAEINPVAGRYEISNGQMLALVVMNGRLFSSSGGLPDEEFIPVADGWFASVDRNVRFAPKRDAAGALTGLTLRQDNKPYSLQRIGPLFSAVAQQGTLDATLSARVETVVQALNAGGAGLTAIPGLTEGARHDFSSAPAPSTKLHGLVFVGSSDVSGPDIKRHGGTVSRVLYYRLAPGSGGRFLLVYVTSDGLITDLDIVDE